MAETLAQTFARYAEDAEFREWNEGRAAEYRFVYAHHDENVWKFTLEEWWKFVTKTIRNKGAYHLPLSKHLRDGLRKSIDSDNGNTIRNVYLRQWTVADWKEELDHLASIGFL